MSFSEDCSPNGCVPAARKSERECTEFGGKAQGDWLWEVIPQREGVVRRANEMLPAAWWLGELAVDMSIW